MLVKKNKKEEASSPSSAWNARGVALERLVCLLQRRVRATVVFIVLHSPKKRSLGASPTLRCLHGVGRYRKGRYTCNDKHFTNKEATLLFEVPCRMQ